MAVLSKRERRRESAQRHAVRTYTCPLCGTLCRGNGGKTSHQRKHMLDDGVRPEEIAFRGHKQAWRAYRLGALGEHEEA